MEIVALGPGDDDHALALSPLFDGPADPGAVRRFLSEPTHHLLVANADDGEPIGFVSGVEITHPDKGTELLLYELGVAEEHRRRGVATALVAALAEIARAAGCYGMWVLTEVDNDAAQATYRRAGGSRADGIVMFDWSFER